MSRSSSPPLLMIWWIIWVTTAIGLVVIYSSVGEADPGRAAESMRYLPVMPLLFAVLVRWFVLPRVTQLARAFPIFVIGLALAEACGLMGFFLVPELAPTYLVLSLVGLFQFVPFFAARYKG